VEIRIRIRKNIKIKIKLRLKEVVNLYVKTKNFIRLIKTKMMMTTVVMKFKIIGSIKIIRTLKVLGEIKDLEEDQMKIIQLLLQKEASLVIEEKVMINEFLNNCS
jgi:hypothetical protein